MMEILTGNLITKKCKSCEGGIPALSNTEIVTLLQQLEGWELFNQSIVRTYNFKDYYQVMAFINSLAWIAHQEDHHPDITFGYKKCRVEYSTHAVNGLTENDFICAAKIDVLFKG